LKQKEQSYMIRVGIIGAGGAADFLHVPDVKSMPEINELKAVADSAELCDKRAKDYGAKNYYSDYRKLLEDAEIPILKVFRYLGSKGHYTMAGAEESRKSLALVLEIYESARSGKPIRL
jgi:hypothetical protein